MNSFDDFARKQRGYLDRKQASEAGLSDEQTELLVERGLWQRPQRGVYLTGSARADWEGRVRAACMAAGGDARAMGRTAARLHELDAAEGHSIIEITVSNGRGPTPRGVIVRRTRRPQPALTTTINGIAVSTVNQTLLECAWLIRADPPIERAVEDAFRRKTDEGALRRFLGQCGKGVPGVTHLRKVLDERLDGRPARSGFEVIVGSILREYGVVLPERRVLVAIPPDQKFELDLAYVDRKVDLEAMGEKWHSTVRQRRADAERRRVLSSFGWSIVEVWWDQAMHAPSDVAARVRSARG